MLPLETSSGDVFSGVRIIWQLMSLLIDEPVEVRYLSGEQDLSNYTVPNVKLGGCGVSLFLQELGSAS